MNQNMVQVMFCIAVALVIESRYVTYNCTIIIAILQVAFYAYHNCVLQHTDQVVTRKIMCTKSLSRTANLHVGIKYNQLQCYHNELKLLIHYNSIGI